VQPKQYNTVFGYGGDPVQQGLVASLNRPGGNVTAMTSLSGELIGKQLGMLHELLPKASHFGFLIDPRGLARELRVKEAQAAASAIGGTIEVLTASTSGDIDTVFARLANEKRVHGLLVPAYPFFLFARVQLAILAARFAVPAIGRLRPPRTKSRSPPASVKPEATAWAGSSVPSAPPGRSRPGSRQAESRKARPPARECPWTAHRQEDRQFSQ
jgi:hypothetical protein